MSVLLLQTLAFAVAAWFTPFAVPVGLAAFCWRALSPDYFGNMVIYANFVAAALLPVWALTVTAAAGGANLGRWEGIICGLFGAVALWSDPFSFYPLAWSLGVMALAGSWRAAALAALVVAACSGGWIGFLWATKSLGSFWADAVWFNLEVYSRYRNASAVPLSAALHQAVTGLGILDVRWQALSVGHPYWPDRWVFTGLLYRISVWVVCTILIARRKFLAAAFVYGCASVELAVFGEERFRANPFVIQAILAASWVSAQLWCFGAGSPSWARIASRAGGACVLVALLWAGSSSVSVLVRNPQRLSYTANFGVAEWRAGALRALACGREDVRLAVYPSEPLLHFLTGMPPVSRYLFLFPWVAEVGLNEVMQDLERHPAVVWVDVGGEVWGYRNRDYLAPLLALLEREYLPLGTGLYVSPVLEQCARQ